VSSYTRGQGDGLDSLIVDIRELTRRIRELENPTGTQLTSLVAQVKAKLAELDATVSALVSTYVDTYTYNTAEIDAKVASPGNISPGTVNASGVGTFNAGLKSTDVHTLLLTYGGAYTATWCHVDGTLGTVPSSARFKRDFRAHGIDLTALDRAEVVAFRYRSAVNNLGDDAEYVIGGIAEQFVDAGLGHTVVRDEAGEPFSIEDRPLLYTLLAGYQALAARVADLEAA
jgi:hypothetical protein